MRNILGVSFFCAVLVLCAQAVVLTLAWAYFGVTGIPFAVLGIFLMLWRLIYIVAQEMDA